MTDLCLRPAPRRTADPAPAPPPPAAPATTTLGAATTELCDALVRAHDEGRLGDVRLCDALESLTLVLWSRVLEHAGLPSWSAMPSPRHRWVVLERAAWRLSHRVADAHIGALPVGDLVETHLARVRQLLTGEGSSPT